MNIREATRIAKAQGHCREGEMAVPVQAIHSGLWPRDPDDNARDVFFDELARRRPRRRLP